MTFFENPKTIFLDIMIIAIVIVTFVALFNYMLTTYEVGRCYEMSYKAQQDYPNYFITEAWDLTCKGHGIEVDAEVKSNLR